MSCLAPQGPDALSGVVPPVKVLTAHCLPFTAIIGTATVEDHLVYTVVPPVKVLTAHCLPFTAIIGTATVEDHLVYTVLYPAPLYVKE